MGGDVNVFISDFSRQAWGFGGDSTVIHHGIDTEVFKPAPRLVKKEAHALSVCNDWINRDWCCGYNLWREVTKDLPVHVLGDTPGLSKPAASVAELVMQYRKAQVFVNTSLISPVPTSLLEAMSCGCAVVSTATCMIPSFLINGVNGLISNDPGTLRAYTKTLLEKPELAAKLGEAARKTILEQFSLDSFVSNWRGVFDRAASLTFTR
jgi:glycosyltransferase involved in cell wall biosynthesis